MFFSPPVKECQAYLQGALHDGTRSTLHGTYRICQKGTDWRYRLQALLAVVGCRSWIYQEGRMRDVFVLETTAVFLNVNYDPDLLADDGQRVAYIRGYFDAEVGIPR